MSLPYSQPSIITTTDLVLGDTTGTALSASTGPLNKTAKQIQSNINTLESARLVEHNNDGTHNKLTKVTDPYIDVRSYGAVGDGVTDDTAAIQAAIDVAKAAGGGTVFFPPKTFAITSITRKKFVRLKGSGMRKTKLLALTSASSGLILTDIGPVLFSNIEDMSIYGNTGVDAAHQIPLNAGQWGIYSEATPLAPDNNGGEWYSNHKNIEIRFFDNGIWYKGGDTETHILPHQFITHENINVNRSYGEETNTLKMTGQVGQFLDLNGNYDGKYDLDGNGNRITHDWTGTNILISLTPGVTANIGNSYTLNFIGTTSQIAKHAYNIKYGHVINITGNNIESTHKAINVESSSRGINIKGNKFANAGTTGTSASSGGSILSVSSTSSVTFEDNYIFGAYDKVITGSSTYGIKASGNMFEVTDIPYAMTSGITIQKTVDEGPPVSLNLQLHRDILVNTSASVITWINSLLMPVECIYLRAWTGPITLGTGGNIYLGGVSSVVVPHNTTAILRRSDIINASNTWTLISVNKPPETVSEDYLNGSPTLNVRSSPDIARYNTPLTNTRSVIIPTNNAVNGDKFRVVREAGATGAYNIDVKMLDSLSVPISAGYSTLKSLTNSPSAGQWCDVNFDGTAWRLTAYGTL